MYIGNVLQERMDCFGFSKEKLCEEALVDIEELDMILNNNISYDDIDAITLKFISDTLYCKPEYFIDKKVRENDLINIFYGKEKTTPKINKVVGKLKEFAEDLVWLIELQREQKY